jgi:hypothetical protein
MHCIVISVKFDDGLSISILRNKQLFEKIMDIKSSHSQKVKFLMFQTPLFVKRTDLGKSSTFLDLIFLVNGMDNLTSNLT